MKPFFASWSCAVLTSLLAKRPGFDSATPSVCCSMLPRSSGWEERFVPPVPGCLTMAKFLGRQGQRVDRGDGSSVPGGK
jgi:hypothetical protein